MLLYKRVECPFKTGYRDTRSLGDAFSRRQASWINYIYTWLTNQDLITDWLDHLHIWSVSSHIISIAIYPTLYFFTFSTWSMLPLNVTNANEAQVLVFAVLIVPYAAIQTPNKQDEKNVFLESLNQTNRGLVVHSLLVCCFSASKLVIMRAFQQAVIQITTRAPVWFILLKWGGGFIEGVFRPEMGNKERVGLLLPSRSPQNSPLQSLFPHHRCKFLTIFNEHWATFLE